MRFVAIKSGEQLDIQTLHRARARLVGERTALINQLRGVLFDRGIIIAKGRPKLDRWLRDELASAVGLSERMQGLVNDMVDELHALDARVKQLDREFKALSEADELARLLRTVPVSEHSMRRPWQRRLVTHRPSRRGATLPPGWVSFRAR